ncbi:hypothetical protein DEU56DRAFT_933756 [Suillus clintonianus]|uniref:uncharacterized protein n=1 Tax=Suillus clintonianus TaxID=1904413 RepID=UPI001B87D9BB|nr:uncharacterized protein DEU56DRAFT_933756 [Suillus clintonianus]KAG2114526.1 hypothetical protein DEU56DRAFT_933756 [Suillus clintonianus]
MSAEDRAAVETMLIDYDTDIESIPYTAPPGEEGAEFSHEGGEYEVFQGLAQQMADLSGFLIYHGYLGCSPLHPTVAISLRTLAAYRQSHRTCPRFSVQAQCKALCHLHDIPYQPYLNTQFSDAYDVYLEILHRVDSLIKAALKRDTQDWRLLNSCPCCCYKLDDEDNMTFEWLATIDGNNSLKRWSSSIYGTSPRDDSRTRRSDYWLHRCEHPTDDWEDVVQSDSAPFNCVDRWRNAGPEARKRMFSVFDESGIFIAACRHRFILLVCDMVKSGELSKYPLAILDHLLNVYGKNGGVAYDIGCAFSKTLENSCLGPRARELNLRLMVGAFHGHAHNRRCQIDWHPMYIEGTGHTEGEGCEHIFSSSNELARSTRHATPFHRHQTIEQHFAFWDDDKYAALSTFLQNHYREALTAIQTLTSELSSLEGVLNLTHTDFVRFHKEERSYLDGLKEPPVKDRVSVRYVQALDEVVVRQKEWNTAREAANRALVDIHVGGYQEMHTAINQARIRVDGSYSKLQNAEAMASHLEIQLGIDKRWEIDSELYRQFHQEASLLTYRTALDDLERLVVMRLFELSKLSLSGTGYKLRQQISKALQRRSQAIRNALSRFNLQAAALVPPRPQLTWKDIVEYSFLGEFDLLRQSRSDIRTLDWTKPAHREATVKYFKLQRAREEIQRLNIEIRRLRTAIHDEELTVNATINSLLVSNKPVGLELQRQWRSRAAINAAHLFRLDRIMSQAGFSGKRGLGTRLNGTSSHEPERMMATSTISTTDEQSGGDNLEHEEQEQNVEDFADFLASVVE